MSCVKSVEGTLYLGSSHWGLNKIAAILQTRIHYLIIFSADSFYLFAPLDAGVIGPLSQMAIITFNGQILVNIHTVWKHIENMFD